MTWLQQSTARNLKMGPFVDNSDGYTTLTGLNITQSDIRISKNGGDFAQSNNAAGGTHNENGWYNILLDSTDTNTLGDLKISINMSSALPVWEDITIVTSNVYNSMISGTDNLEVDMVLINNSGVSSTISSKEQISDQVWDEILSGHVGPGTSSEILKDTLNDTAEINAEWNIGGTSYDTLGNIDTLVNTNNSKLVSLENFNSTGIGPAVWSDTTGGFASGTYGDSVLLAGVGYIWETINGTITGTINNP